MTDVNLYFYFEDLALTVAQRNTLVDQLKLLGQRNAAPQPRDRNHCRVRPDGKAVIFEAWWDDAHLSAVAIRNRLAAIFSVAQTSITYSTSTNAYGSLVTYTYSSVQRLRLGVFAGLAATYQQSQVAALAFLAANPAWQPSS